MKIFIYFPIVYIVYKDIMNLFTIGYEGRQIDEFVDLLRRFNISRIIDVREMPISRKNGFSKSSLREHLRAANIDYVHLKALGSPAALRHKLRYDRDYEYFFAEYHDYLSQNHEEINKIVQFVSDGNNCIMCFERSHEKCHRRVLVDRINDQNRNGLKIRHI